jgi:hypothetical protein
MEIACRPVLAKNSVGERTIPKFGRTFHNSKNMVFNVKKLLNNGIDLRLWRRGKKK